MKNKLTSSLVLTAQGALDYNLLGADWLNNILNNFQSLSYQDQLLYMANILYNIFLIMAVMYFGYKIAEGLFRYQQRAVHAIQKNQMIEEIKEPLIGLVLFVAGGTLIKQLAKLVLGIIL